MVEDSRITPVDEITGGMRPAETATSTETGRKHAYGTPWYRKLLEIPGIRRLWVGCKRIWGVLSSAAYLRAARNWITTLVPSTWAAYEAGTTISKTLDVASLKDWEITTGGGWALLFLTPFVVALFLAWPFRIGGKVARDYDSRISVEKGDLLALDCNEAEIVVGTSTTFETNPDLITRRSLQFQLQKRIPESWVEERHAKGQPIGKCLYPDSPQDYRTAEALKGELDEILGKLYPGRKPGEPCEVGEIVTIPFEAVQSDGDRVMGGDGIPRTVRFLAYTHINGELKFDSFGREATRGEITSSVDDIWVALSSLWETLRKPQNPDLEVALPIIGTVATGLGGELTKEDCVKLIMLSYAFAVRRFKGDIPNIRIVVLEDEFYDLNRSELAQFRKSLERSN